MLEFAVLLAVRAHYLQLTTVIINDLYIDVLPSTTPTRRPIATSSVVTAQPSTRPPISDTVQVIPFAAGVAVGGVVLLLIIIALVVVIFIVM